MTDEERNWLIFSGLTITGLIIWANLDEPKTYQKRQTSRRSFTNERTEPRDPFESFLSGNKNDEKVSSPNLLAKISSTKSRSSGSFAGSNSLTSKQIEKVIVPLIGCPIRKYPSDYYNLNKKAQWRYRKSHPNLQAV